MKFRIFFALSVAGAALLCAAPIAHAGGPSCGGEEEPKCIGKENPPKQPPPPEQLQFVLTVNVIGNGHVAGTGISCPDDCVQTFAEHTVVVLVPIAAPGSRFRGWNGDCSGTGICVLVMDENHQAGAVFDPKNVPPDEIGPTTDPAGGDGTAGGSTNVTLGFQCYSNDELWIDELYLDVLASEGDVAGIATLSDLLKGGSSREDVALVFLQSVEYRTLLVQTWYQRFLHRSPTADEIANLVGMLVGATDEDVEAAILGSDEYYNSRGGGTNAGFVEALYQDILGRAPTDAEAHQWDVAIGAGATRNEVALQILTSIEARTLLVNAWFQTFLGRAPTPVELNFFLQQFGAGATDEQLLASLLGSQEYFDAVGDYKGAIHWGDGTTTTVVVRHTTATGEVCVVDGNHVFPNQGDIPITVDITDPDGHTQTFDGVLRIQLPPLPPPGKENVQPFGKVFIKVNGQFVPLTGFAVIPLGTEPRHDGRARSRSPRTTARPATSTRGSSGSAPRRQDQTFIVIVLTGGNFGGCTSTTRKLSAPGRRSRPKWVRHVWGNAKGHFRTKGKYASATIRGTLWLTNDVCGGTWVTSAAGSSTSSTSSSASTSSPARALVPREAERLVATSRARARAGRTPSRSRRAARPSTRGAGGGTSRRRSRRGSRRRSPSS